MYTRRQKLKKYIFFILTFSIFAYAKCEKTVNISFLSGIRYIDGHGDLGLNEGLIREQKKALEKAKSHYGPGVCVKLHVVFMPEVVKKSDDTGLTKNAPNDYSHVKKIYNKDFFKRATDQLLNNDGKPKGTKKPVEVEGISFWLQDDYLNDKTHDIALQIMASDTSQTLESSYHIPKEFRKKANTISFLEYNSADPTKDKGVVWDSKMYESGGSSPNFHLRINSGPNTTGLYFNSTHKEQANNGKSEYRESVNLVVDDLMKDDPEYFPVNNSLRAKINNYSRANIDVIPFHQNSFAEGGNELSYISSYLDTFNKWKKDKAAGKDKLYLYLNNIKQPFSLDQLKQLLTDYKQKKDPELNLKEVFSQLEEFDKKVFRLDPKKYLPLEKFYNLYNNPGNYAVSAGGYTTFSESIARGTVPNYTMRGYQVKPFLEIKSSLLQEVASENEQVKSIIMDRFFFESSVNLRYLEKSIERNVAGGAATSSVDYDHMRAKLGSYVDNHNVNTFVTDAIIAFVDQESDGRMGIYTEIVDEMLTGEVNNDKNRFFRLISGIMEGEINFIAQKKSLCIINELRKLTAQ